jgi:hypothetical protein
MVLEKEEEYRLNRYIVKLSEEEKKDLHALTHKGTCGVRKLRRAHRCWCWPTKGSPTRR